MPKITLYGLEKCSTCAKARAWLNERKIAHEFIDYREHPIAPALLRQWAAQLGWEKLVNRASYAWRDLPEARKAPVSEREWLALIAEFPALVKRPVVVAGDGVEVGFSEKKFAARFGQ